MPKKLTTEEWIAKAANRWGKKFDYSRVDYKSNTTPIEIHCSKHGWFQTTPKTHLLNRPNATGGPRCGRKATSQKNTTFTKEELGQDKKICKECGKNLPLESFSSKSSVYIFPRCKTCMRGAERLTKECPICGKTFEATNQSRKIYCSRKRKKTNDLNQQSIKLHADRERRIEKEELEIKKQT